MIMSEWIKNLGEMAVEKGTLVDVEHRDGKKFFGETAGSWYATDWTIDERNLTKADIIRWKLHEEEAL